MRPGRWGNHFVIGRDGTREQVIEKYRLWIESQLDDESFRDELRMLSRAEGLVCCCAPDRCHGEVLIEVMIRLGFLHSSKG